MIKYNMLIILFLLFSNVYAAENSETVVNYSPFEIIEKKLKLEEKQFIELWKKSDKNEKKEIEELLKDLYINLHNIRHYKAFRDLWKKFNWQKDKITILYPASGGHIAPFEIIHSGKIKEATFIFTEVDHSVIPRLEILLRELENHGFYRDVEIKIFPLYGQIYESTVPAKDASQEEVQRWIKSEINKKGQAPPLEVIFSFKFNNSLIYLNLILKGTSKNKGSTDLYRIDDFEKADLIITHDWSFDPRENLHLLKLFIESACAINKKNILIMMENLESYPMPIDIKIFNIISKTNLDYGHSYYYTLPNNKQIEWEGEFSLYGGGVILNPDLNFFCDLNEAEKRFLFDLIILKEYGFDRANYDIINMKKVPAPLLLDLYIGYSYKNIDGNKISSEYLTEIVENISIILSKNKDEKISNNLCKYIKLFRKTLEEMSNSKKRNEKVFIQDNSLSNPFLVKESTKINLQKAKNDPQKIRDILKIDEYNSKKALTSLNKKYKIINKFCNDFN